ncbi:MAG: site-specific DNA-methyltransferase [Oligoflexales bacterium]|nr:site-specific DNA-methyltransferase [Oligoflexales bacterium]
MKSDPVVKFGDIWQMGHHRLLCGDATEKAMISEFLDGQYPKLCVTDPPYGINYHSKNTNRELYKLKVKNDHIISWGHGFRETRATVLYVWFSYKHYEVVARAIQDAGYEIKQLCIWSKNHFSLQRHLYHLKHEQCLVCVKQGVKSSNVWTGDRKQTSVWEVPTVNFKHRIHPTEKPVELYEIPIRNHLSNKEFIFDPFAGSGTVFAAAEKQNCYGLGVELCPETCTKILVRMSRLGPNQVTFIMA